MTTPTGTITLQDVENEFGGTGSISLSEYYRGGLVTQNNTGVPTSGALSMNNLRGTTASIAAITYTLEQVFTGVNGTYSASIQAGDLLVMTMSRAASFGDNLANTTYRPAGFTQTALADYTGNTGYLEWAGYAIASASTAGSTFLGPLYQSCRIVLHVYRPDKVIASVTVRDINTQSTTGDPAAQVKNGSSYSNPHVILGFLGHNNSATKGFSWAGSTYDRYTVSGSGYANNRTITQGFDYGDGVDVTVDAGNLGWGMLHSCIFELT